MTEVAIYVNAGGGDDPNPESLFERVTVDIGPGAFMRLVEAHHDEEVEGSGDVAHTDGTPDAPYLVVWEDGCMVERRDLTERRS